MELKTLLVTAPLPVQHKGSELTARLGNLAAAYCIAALAGAFLVLLVAVLLHLQSDLAIDVIPLLRALSAIAAVFAIGFLAGRMNPKVPR